MKNNWLSWNRTKFQSFPLQSRLILNSVSPNHSKLIQNVVHINFQSSLCFLNSVTKLKIKLPILFRIIFKSQITLKIIKIILKSSFRSWSWIIQHIVNSVETLISFSLVVGNSVGNSWKLDLRMESLLLACGSYRGNLRKCLSVLVNWWRAFSIVCNWFWLCI